MAATVATVAYLGLEARAVEVQVQLSSGLPAFAIVGLPAKAVADSRERARAASAGGRPGRPAAGASACPIGAWRKAGSAGARRVRRLASRFRPSGARSTCRR